ncbi:MAG TPA: DUF1801 domain-containing protein [Candidatus Saccharimonadales bacterium]|nr:DUF1801 domain-containing protein [Candidatus Saccharimonadales bacterium]
MSSSIQKQVEEFIRTKVRPEYRPLVEAFRTFIKSDFPQLKEEMRGGTENYYGTPVYRLKRIVLVISPSQHGITFAFSEGKLFQDKYGMLEGVGNKTLNIRLSSPAEFDETKMRYYVQQAIDLDEQRP